MSRNPRRFASDKLAAIAGAAWVLVSAAPAKELAPFRAALEVRWSGEAGSDAFRTDLARYVGNILGTRCFVAVFDGNDPAAAQADVHLAIVLSDVFDETRYDDSIAQTLEPGESSKELRRVATFEVRADATLSGRESGKIVQKKHLVAHVSHRPLFPGEDPQAAARAEVIDRIGNDVAGWLGCGRAKLEKNIRAVLDAAPPKEPEPR